MEALRRSVKRICLIIFGIGAVSVALSACSFFESKITVPAPKSVAPPPQVKQECEQPYCSIDLDFPVSQITNPKIYVMKAERRLYVVQDKVLVRDYHVGLGPSPRGDKYYRGDGRTPEGEYFVCSKNAASQYYKSLGINYPSPRHAENALCSGVISYNDYCSIVQANDAKKLPPPNTPLGGLIMIHGGGAAGDWTLGCVAVPNRAMDELFSIASIGTPICIMP